RGKPPEWWEKQKGSRGIRRGQWYRLVFQFPIRQAAVACGITSKGPWRSSKTPGINQALSNAYLKSQGLYELRDGWIKLHHS
ncbi:hypothetical protein ACRWX2_25705, partial [Escherichia coli]